ncbi:hypothetical protein BgiMline_031227 [Biomphalaria glabrata]
MKTATLLLIHMHFLSGMSMDCRPTLIGETKQFHVIINHTYSEPLEVVWLKGKSPVSMCRQTLACYDYRNIKTETKLQSIGDGLFGISITLSNVSRSDEVLWSLKYLGLASLKNSSALYSCDLKAFDFAALELRDCQDTVEEGSIARCWCQKKVDFKQNISLTWVDQSNRVMDNGSHMLSFIAKRDNLGYTCRGHTVDGTESLPLTYKPNVQYNDSSITYFYSARVLPRMKSSFVYLFLASITLTASIYTALIYFYCRREKRCLRKRIPNKDEIATKKMMHPHDDCINTMDVSKTKSHAQLCLPRNIGDYTHLRTNTIIDTLEWNKELHIINDSEDSDGYGSMNDSSFRIE